MYSAAASVGPPAEPFAVAQAKPSFNATLWAVRGPHEIACFRVQVDKRGRVTDTSLTDFKHLAGKKHFDELLRAKLRERYGEETVVTVVEDGGAGFDDFQRAVRAGAYPIPPVPEAAQER